MMNVSKSDILHLEANGMQALHENFGPRSQGRASAGVYMIQRPSDSYTLAIIPWMEPDGKKERTGHLAYLTSATSCEMVLRYNLPARPQRTSSRAYHGSTTTTKHPQTHTHVTRPDAGAQVAAVY